MPTRNAQKRKKKKGEGGQSQGRIESCIRGNRLTERKKHGSRRRRRSKNEAGKLCGK